MQIVKATKGTDLEPDHPSLFCILRVNNDPFKDDTMVYIKEKVVKNDVIYYSYSYRPNEKAWSSCEAECTM